MADTRLPIYREPQAVPPWYSSGLRFKCTQCGNCCGGGPGYVWLTLDDMSRIAEFLNLPFNDFTRKYVRKTQGAFSLVERPGYDCIFLNRADGKATCGIYAVRPTQCRTWPFWDMNLQSPQAWTHAAARCPGMCDGDAPTYSLVHIEKCRTHPESPV
ncbi:MAG: YkgJ family cysteine cluster protein [Phycisphaerae bacterium]